MKLLEKTQKSGDDQLFRFYKEGLLYKYYNEDAVLFVEKV